MTPAEHKALVVAYGNLSRGDDALAHHVLQELRPRLGPATGVELLAVHQLDVAMAELVAAQDLVIFVDAAVGEHASEPVHTAQISAEALARADMASHSLSPQSLLGLAGWLYGRVPRAAMVTVRAELLGFGEELTPEVRASVPLAARAVMDILADFV